MKQSRDGYVAGFVGSRFQSRIVNLESMSWHKLKCRNEEVGISGAVSFSSGGRRTSNSMSEILVPREIQKIQYRQSAVEPGGVFLERKASYGSVA